MNTETWSLSLSLSSSFTSSAPCSHPSKPYYPTFPSCKTKFPWMLINEKRCWKKVVVGRKEPFMVALLDLRLGQPGCPVHLKNPRT